MQSFQATSMPLEFAMTDLQGIIVAIENPSDIIVASQRPYGSRAVLKFSSLDQMVQCRERENPEKLKRLRKGRSMWHQCCQVLDHGLMIGVL